jgi:hypothetical protein
MRNEGLEELSINLILVNHIKLLSLSRIKLSRRRWWSRKHLHRNIIDLRNLGRIMGGLLLMLRLGEFLILLK